LHSTCTFLFCYDMSSMAKATVSAPKQCSTMLQHPWNFSKIIRTFFHMNDRMQPLKPVLLPNTGWNHISVNALGKLTCKSKRLPFSGKHLTLDH
jgi:hypothetical protein